MNSEHPADYSPLSYGAGLAIGLMLLLGLPAEARKPPVNVGPPPKRPMAIGARLAAGVDPAIGETRAAETAGCGT